MSTLINGTEAERRNGARRGHVVSPAANAVRGDQ